MRRFRVRAAHKTWNDAGPDLLRHVDNAKQTLRGIARKADGKTLYVKVNRESEWRGPHTRARAMELFDRASKHAGFEEFRLAVGVGRNSEPELLAVVQFAQVELLELPGCGIGTSVAWSLAKHQFPTLRFGGGKVVKETFPGFWSDHAWGDAVDDSDNPPEAKNDEVFDWNRRMAQSGNMKAEYIIGSRNGQVVDASAPDWEVGPSGAAVSHTWHVHVSVIDHDGKKPPGV